MRALWMTAALAFLIDQVSKYGVIFGLGSAQGDVPVLPPLLTFKYGLNTGVNFGLFASGSDVARYALIAIALTLSAILVWWARSFRRPVEHVSAGLVVGGALGNALDRVFHPGVLDFINMSCCGLNNPYVFNLADVFIFAGAFGLILFSGERDGKNDA
ncbi:MAG: signal peptidase II [Pseudomonadota bacterium]